MTSAFCTCSEAEWKKFESDGITLGEVIGKGINGSVYSGEIKSDHTKIVIKPLSEETFEIEAAKCLCSEYIANVLGIIQADASANDIHKHLCLVMRKYENGSVDKKLNELTLKQRSLILYRVCCAVAYMHQKKWTHGDLAARNILLDVDKQGFLCDMGYARPFDAGPIEEKRKVPLGLWSPDLTRNRKQTAASDVWQLGILTLELMVDGFSIPEDSKGYFHYQNTLLQKKKLDMKECPWDMIQKLPSSFQELVTKCLKINSKSRPTAQNMADELKLLLGQQARLSKEITSLEIPQQPREFQKQGYEYDQFSSDYVTVPKVSICRT